MENIFETIRQEWSDFIDGYIRVVPGYSFNQYSTIKRCHLYFNSRFEKASNADNIFFNIVKDKCKVSTRFLNFDTKDIKIVSNTPDSEIKAFFLEKELKYWLKKNRINRLLNEVAEELPIYGSVVIKKTPKGASLVDLRRFALDQGCDYVKNSRFVIQKHYLTESELRAKKKDGWENVDLLIEKGTKEYNEPDSYDNVSTKNPVKSTPYYMVFERYGEVPKSWITGERKDEEEKVRSIFICGNIYDVTQTRDANGNIQGLEENGITLFKSEWSKDWPFKDFHFCKTKGRWLGVGNVEDLFDIQVRRNEIANQKRTSMEISSIHLFQTPGTTILSNIIKDLENGDVIQTGANGVLSPLATEERNLNAFTTEENVYNELAQSLTFSYESVRGGDLPSTTPATNAVLQNNNASSVFMFIRENLGIGLQEFFNDSVLPQLIKDLTPEHILTFTGGLEELQKLDEMITKFVVREDIVNDILNGRQVTPELASVKEELVKQELRKSGNKRFITMKESFYKDADLQFDFITTNEQENIAVMTQNISQLMIALSQNPALLQNPLLRLLFNKYAQRLGINPYELELADQKNIEAQQQQAQVVQMQQMAQQKPIETNQSNPVANATVRPGQVTQ